jgi:hypothetical protein
MGAGLWAFLPTYNEAENLESVVRETAAQLEQAVPGDWRLLVVDDASPRVSKQASRSCTGRASRVSVRPTSPVSGKLSRAAPTS